MSPSRGCQLHPRGPVPLPSKTTLSRPSSSFLWVAFVLQIVSLSCNLILHLLQQKYAGLVIVPAKEQTGQVTEDMYDGGESYLFYALGGGGYQGN